MFDNRGIAGETIDQQFLEGTPVFDAAGEKVGTVSEHNVQGGYLVVHKGWLFPKDLYVPLNVVERADADGVYVQVYKDDMSSRGWDNPPRSATYDNASVAGATTYESTTMRGAGTAGAGAFSRTEAEDRAGLTTADAKDVRVPVVEEELVAGTRRREEGRVRVHKDVVEEQETVTVPVTREEVRVERVPVRDDDAAADVTDAFVERDVEVPVMGEEAVVEKRAHVVEEVLLRKDVVADQQQVGDTVRKERVVVEGADE
jgi:uncharacterized protein (TIGR02271 family)